VRQARAPKGFHTEVDVQITLKGNRRHRREWDTALALAPAYHQALKWIRDELKEGKVPGFTTIQRVQVDVRYEEGEYEAD
jgi:hypothetical protein